MIENEVKYVLRWDSAFETALRNRYIWTEIKQAYLDDHARIREKTWFDARGVEQSQFLFTYKQRLPNGHNVEIETRILRQDYVHLLEFSTHRLQKGRVSFRQDGVLWDIDFPRWGKGQYFAIAEAEMPEEMDRPPSVPDIIQSRIVFAVPRDDDRFTARRLSDGDYARRLAETLGCLGDGAQQPRDSVE